MWVDHAGGPKGARVLPKGVHYIFQVIDAAVAERADGRRIPIVLITHEHGPGEPETAGEETAQSWLVSAYRERLSRQRGPGRDGLDSIVPHAYVDDAALVASYEPHIALVESVRDQLRRSMRGSGVLRFPCLDPCLTILRTEAGVGTAKDTLLRDTLYAAYKAERSWLDWLPELANAVGKQTPSGGWFDVVRIPASRLVRRVYTNRLRRTHRWLEGVLQAPGGDFLGTALEIVKDGPRRGNEPLVQRILLMALMRDLAKAVRGPWPGWLWGRRRPGRPWPFVVLLGTVGDPGAPSRAFLDRYTDLARTEDPAPLMILGALTGEVPPYAFPLTPDAGPGAAPARGRSAPMLLADRLSALYARGDDDGAGVHLLPLSAEPDEGMDADWLQANPKVVPPRVRRRAKVRPYLPVIVASVLLAALTLVLRPGPAPSAAPVKPSSCRKTKNTDEIVGVTDGLRCTLAGPQDTVLRELERIAGEQNKALTPGRAYRSVVFLAPLTNAKENDNAVPSGIPALRGALLAQRQINKAQVRRMPVRLLIANAGEQFRYGSDWSRDREGIDVAQMIIDAAAEEHVAGVIGITQSRQESLRAAHELDRAQIPVIATGTVGSKMVDFDAPPRYFQVSPTNDRISRVLADFAVNSEDLRKLTGPGPATAVIVHDPADEFFSADLTDKFGERYLEAGGDVRKIAYLEKGNDRNTRDVAEEICRTVKATNGFVLYTGRSGVMPNLFGALQHEPMCEKSEGTIAVLAESVDPDLITAPERMGREYPYLTLFYSASNPIDDGDLKHASTRFSRDFRETFHRDDPDIEAAGGFDALNVLSEVINAVYTAHSDGDVRPSDVYQHLLNTGITHLGATGRLRLDGRHKYPPDKAVYIREIDPQGRILPRLACGILHNTDVATTWGPKGRPHPCPRDP
ncbi:hypothetical protein Skr01_52180 [Sphaerisporangium krabiense]|uniref:ABC-type branched-subunit amino acid transport system substrate-binding protein n=1 Tax=Sphaerisporangium krabiense TaxID=763782 RepID=A0A7W8ZA33_9ACTN|nr:ABC transporter substrate-binding protein [Sphaerisporangium krabiense]MBB5630182.1 ABC-type branched-subunit amino acid transport system substrate-binding protein [Sphaerisporangium krabiense]GII65133.1 hypothetical protein Skr01_52180 [Sphaerisporangium krabiense]